MRVLLSSNPYRDRGLRVALEARRILNNAGAETALCLPFAPRKGDRLDLPRQVKLGSMEEQLKRADVLLCFGGDGTILHAARDATLHDVPILGVNMGSVGFMAELERGELSLLTLLAAGEYRTEERMMLSVRVLRGEKVLSEDLALNDAVISKGSMARVAEMEVRADGVLVTNLMGDGVIVSTPTGSTAYAFSAGGPVMWPNVKALQLIPLAAHALFARPLIIGSGSTFTIDILDDSMSEGWICCDGRRQRALPQGTRVMVRESRDTLRLARLSGVPFTNRLVSKFDLPVVGWREHARNEASSQSLHHGHTFPAAAYAAGVAVAGDAGVAGTEPDKPGERDGKAGS